VSGRAARPFPAVEDQAQAELEVGVLVVADRQEVVRDDLGKVGELVRGDGRKEGFGRRPRVGVSRR